jgi:hypothetical protein
MVRGGPTLMRIEVMGVVRKYAADRALTVHGLCIDCVWVVHR